MYKNTGKTHAKPILWGAPRLGLFREDPFVFY